MAAVAVVAVVALVGGCTASARTDPPPATGTEQSSTSVPTTSVPFVPGPDIPVEDVRGHLTELEKIAAANGGNRAHGQPGYLASLEYLRTALDAAGFVTTLTEFDDGGHNLVADWPGGDQSAVMMFGAHADSVRAGPGINDNGSGSAALLEVALAVAEQDLRPTRHLRFAWWGAEELGLLGSTAYVRSLPADEVARIKGYVNVDMLASPNAGYFVYSSAGQPDGSTTIENVLRAHFTAIDVPTEPVDIGGRSDHAAFASAGIPTGGLFTGAEGTMTEEQASKWGGTAGAPFDPCYHDDCDDATNIDLTALERNTDALAAAVWTLTS